MWGYVADKKKIKELLLRFQRKAALRIIKEYRTISTNSAILLASIILLDHKIRQLSDFQNLKTEGEILPNNTIYTIDRPPAVDSYLHPARRYSHLVNYNELRSLKVFTDRSCASRGTGAAFKRQQGLIVQQL